MIVLSGCAPMRTAYDPAGPCAQLVLHRVSRRQLTNELWRDGELVASVQPGDLDSLLADDPAAHQEARRAIALYQVGVPLLVTGLLQSVISGVALARDASRTPITRADPILAPMFMTMGPAGLVAGLITLGVGGSTQLRAIDDYEQRSGQNGCQ